MQTVATEDFKEYHFCHFCVIAEETSAEVSLGTRLGYSRSLLKRSDQ